MLACLLGCGYSLHRDAPWGQRRQPKAHSPASTQAGCIPTSFSSKPTPSPTARATLARSRGNNFEFREQSVDAPGAPRRSRGRPLAPRDRTPPSPAPPHDAEPPTWAEERAAVFEAICETLSDQLAAIRWRQLGSAFDTPAAAFGALKQWATTVDGGSNDKPKRNA